MIKRIPQKNSLLDLKTCTLLSIGALPALAKAAVKDEAGLVGPSDTTASVLLLVGIFLLLLEIKVVSQGLLGFMATICLIGATIIIWRDGGTFWGIPLAWVIPVIIFVLALGLALTVLSIRAYKEKIASGYESYAGEEAEAFEALNPDGRVFFQGTYWRAESLAPVAKGEKVRIVSADRLRLVVEPLGNSAAVLPHEVKKEPRPI